MFGSRVSVSPIHTGLSSNGRQILFMDTASKTTFNTSMLQKYNSNSVGRVNETRYEPKFALEKILLYGKMAKTDVYANLSLPEDYQRLKTAFSLHHKHQNFKYFYQSSNSKIC